MKSSSPFPFQHRTSFFSAILLTSLTDIHDNKYIALKWKTISLMQKRFVSNILPLSVLNAKILTPVRRHPSDSKRSGGRGVGDLMWYRPGTDRGHP